MKIISNHNHTADEAKILISNQIPNLMERLGNTVSSPTYVWDGHFMEFNFIALNTKFSGTVEITSSDVVFDIAVPPKFTLFRGIIRDEAQKWCNGLFDAVT